MRFFCFLAQAASFLNPNNLPNGNKFRCPTVTAVARNKMSTIGTGGDDNIANAAAANTSSISSSSNVVYKLVPISKEEAKKLNGNEIISHDYIKRLECEKEELNQKLNEKCKLIRDLNTDLKRMETERLLCMIYESYQRFKTRISADLEEAGELKDGMKIEAFLELVKKGKLFSNDRLVYWMINIDNTKGMELLKDFRNNYSHYTNNDLSILRQWRTRIIENSENESIKKSTDNLLNDAALNILNTVIDYLSRPESRPLQRKRCRSKEQVTKLNSVAVKTEMKVVKKSGSELSMMMSKKQRKKLRKAILRKESASNAFTIQEGSVVPDLVQGDCEMKLPISSNLSSGSDLSVEVLSVTSDSSVDEPLSIHSANHKALFEAYHRNSQLIGQLRKDGPMTAQKFAEIRRLRQENQRMVKEKGNIVMCSAKKQQKLKLKEQGKQGKQEKQGK